MTIDLLAFAAHPDDVELAACGTLMAHKALGKSIGIIDLTRGQLGSRGTPQTRAEEAAISTEILQLDCRENLGLEDGWFRNDERHIRAIAEMICKYRPKVLLANAIRDRHPDHGRASQLVSESAFYSGLSQVKYAAGYEAHRPEVVLHYIQDRYIEPDVIVDISDFMKRKMDAIMAFKTQFYYPDSEEPETPISSKDFLEVVEGRAREIGRLIGVEFGEGFTKERGVGVPDLTLLS